jgi:hypothetical protein
VPFNAGGCSSSRTRDTSRARMAALRLIFIPVTRVFYPEAGQKIANARLEETVLA